MVGYAVADTLPEAGPVSRALVHAVDGYLRTIEEIHTVRRHRGAVIRDTPDGTRPIPASQLVSMNLWGFGGELLPFRVEVLDARSRWCGLTTAADLTAVRATLAGLAADGVYPEELWGELPTPVVPEPFLGKK